MKIYTCTARCSTCKKELNRAENVPEAQKAKVTISAPLMAVCDVKSHNTFSDLNLRVDLEWLEQDGQTATAPTEVGKDDLSKM